MGQKIYPLKQWGGLDVDEPWQIPAVEAWLEAHEISKLFQVQRIKWDHLYDSEKTVLSTLELSKHSRVLDMGIDPGGLGVALRERFGVKSYVALVSDPAVGSEAKAVYPESEVVVACAEEYFADQLNAFDLVCVFGAEDSPDFLDNIIPKAYASLKPGGSLLLRVRLTDAPTIQDVQLSSQKVFTRKGLVETNRYIVRNTHEVLDSLRKLSPARIFAYGYSGVPSSTATTPFKIVCFGVFAVTRPGPGGPTEPQIELRLPGHAVRQTC
jgi:SAM-dependent methyltransferase